MTLKKLYELCMISIIIVEITACLSTLCTRNKCAIICIHDKLILDALLRLLYNTIFQRGHTTRRVKPLPFHHLSLLFKNSIQYFVY